MSQRALIAMFAAGLVAVLGMSTLINWAVTSSMIASVTVQGPAGPMGPAGADGADGEDGADGKDGLPGSSTGVTGQRGPAGPTGPAGSDGADAPVTPPIVLATGAGTASVPHYPTITPVTGAGLSVPAGVYAITVDATGIFAVVTSGGGAGSMGTTCYLFIDGASAGGSFDVPVDVTGHNRTIAYLQSFSAAGTLEVRCYSYFGMGFPITNQVNWTNIEISATRLD